MHTSAADDPGVAHIFVLALAAAVYPTLLAGVIVILARPDPARQLAAFLVGGMTISVVSGLVILKVLEGSGEFDSSNRAGSPALDIAGGVITLGLAYVLATGRPARLATARRPRPRTQPAGPSRTKKALTSGSVLLTLALGAILNLPGIWYLAALKDISTGDYGTAGDVALVLAFNLIMFILVEVPLLAYLVSPARSRAAVEGFNAWLHANRRHVAAWVAAVVGTYLLAKGIIEALS